MLSMTIATSCLPSLTASTRPCRSPLRATRNAPEPRAQKNRAARLGRPIGTHRANPPVPYCDSDTMWLTASLTSSSLRVAAPPRAGIMPLAPV